MELLEGLQTALVLAIGLVACLHALFGWRPWLLPARLVRRLRLRRRSRELAPGGRPIQEIARDLRRLGRKFREQPRGLSFVRYEAHRRAYDDVLIEATAALGIVGLIGVLEPGPELDVERARLEWALECAGLELGLPL